MQRFVKQYRRLADRIAVLIKKNLEKGLSPAKAIDAALIEVQYVKTIENNVMNLVAATVTRNGVDIVDTRGFRNWWLNKHWEGEKLTLSKIIRSGDVRNQIVNTVSAQLKLGSAWTRTAKAITDQELVSGNLAKTMTRLVKFARASDQRKLIPELRRAQRHVERLAKDGAPTTRLKKAYQNIINQVERGNIDALDKAVDRAVKAKARFNAERIARTEMSRANSKAQEVRIDTDPDVVGYKSNLSSRHVILDICDVHAEADLYGMGPGVVPANIGIAIPYHPHCLCFVTLVYSSPTDKPKFNPKAGAKYLKENPDVRKGVFNKRDEKRFQKNPNTWQKNARSYEKPYRRDRKRQSIPQRIIGNL